MNVLLRASALLLLTVSAIGAPTAQPPTAPTFTRVYPLAREEGVFAYSRISPDGRLLAYASETKSLTRSGIDRTVTLVDLADGKVLFREPGIDAYFSPDGAG
jgi:hypothetical protein